MSLGGIITNTVNLVVGADGESGLMGSDFGLFLAAGLVISLAVTQLPKLVKRFR